MTLFLGNCLARYLYYIHNQVNEHCRYKWCTNYSFLNNPSSYSEELKNSITTSAPTNYYLGFSEKEKYDKIVITMPQFFVRDKYVKINGRYLELDQVKDKKIKIEETKYTWTNYANYFQEYTRLVKSKFPDSKIIIIFESELPAGVERYYGNYTHQFQNINKADFMFLNNGFYVIEKVDVVNKLINSGYYFDALFPWYTYDSSDNCFKNDKLHISAVYVNEIYQALMNEEEKEQLSDCDNYQNGVNNITDPSNIFNKLDLIGMQVNSSSSWNEIENIVMKNFTSFSEMMDQSETAYLNEKGLTENTATVNIKGYQGIVANICNRVRFLREINNKVLYELIERYNLLTMKLRMNSPLMNHYTENISMLLQLERHL